MRRLDFFKLTRSVQDQLLWAFRGEFQVSPILFQKATRPRPWIWLAVSAAAAAALVALALVGMGDLDAAAARQPLPVIVVYVLLVGLVALGIVQALAYISSLKPLPFPTGYYLLPTNVLDARDRNIAVYPLEEVTGVAPRGSSGVEVAFVGKRFLFRVEPASLGDAVAQVEAARERVRAGLEPADRRLLDPLEQPVVASPLASEVPLYTKPPAWVRLRFGIAALVSVAGVGAYFLRDGASDEGMFAQARHQDDVAAYERYLEVGDAHRDEVARVLLPRAELRLAMAKGDVASIDAFKERFPDTDIGAEVEAARRAALDAAFIAARDERSLQALLDFDATYPGHHLTEQLAAAKHALYVKATKTAKAKTSPQQATAASQHAILGAIVSWAEKLGPKASDEGLRGPAAEVVMRRVPSHALDKADALVRRNPYYVGEPSLPSRYLTDANLDVWAERAAKPYVERFAALFPPEIVRFAAGATQNGDGDLPEVDKPTLIVSYRLEPSGGNYASSKPRGIFIGLVMFTRIDFVVPGQPTFTIKHVINQKIPIKLIVEHDRKKPAGSLEAAIYEAMVASAFAELEERYLKSWF